MKVFLIIVHAFVCSLL